MRSKLEVADIFRRHGDTFRAAQGNRLSRGRPVSTYCVEKLRLIRAPVADSLLLGAGDSADDGRAAGDAGGAVLRLQPRAACPGQSPASQDRPVPRLVRGSSAPGALL